MTAWCPVAARAAAEPILRLMEGRATVLLGAAAPQALGLARPPWCLWQRLGLFDPVGTWCVIPHPSGRNRWYNSEENLSQVRSLLETVYSAHRASVGLGLTGV